MLNLEYNCLGHLGDRLFRILTYLAQEDDRCDSPRSKNFTTGAGGDGNRKNKTTRRLRKENWSRKPTPLDSPMPWHLPLRQAGSQQLPPIHQPIQATRVSDANIRSQ